MARDIIDIAAAEIGYRETGNNQTKYGAWFGMNGAAWCHMFASWCADQAGADGLVPKTASTTTGMNWFIQKGQFKYKGSYTPKRGDFIYFKTGRSHVGLVESCSGGTVYTIEGNSSDQVKRRSYPLSEGTITGYGVPNYHNLNSGSSKKEGSEGSKEKEKSRKKTSDRKSTRLNSSHA